VPRQVHQLKSRITPEENMVRCFAETLSRTSGASLYLVRILVTNFDILRPNLRAVVIKKIKIVIEPARIAEINDIQKITKAISVVKTEYRDVAASVERSNVFNIFSRKGWAACEKDCRNSHKKFWNRITNRDRTSRSRRPGFVWYTGTWSRTRSRSLSCHCSLISVLPPSSLLALSRSSSVLEAPGHRS
jgi:hypothetical protein